MSDAALGGQCLDPILVVFQDNVADGGVGGRHMIVAVDLGHVIIERAAHHVSHDHFDRF